MDLTIKSNALNDCSTLPPPNIGIGENSLSIFDYINSLDKDMRYFLRIILDVCKQNDFLDIKPHQVIIVCSLKKDKTYRITDVEKEIYTGKNLSYNISGLEENGYFVKNISSFDQRSSSIELTPKGNKLQETFEVYFREHFEIILVPKFVYKVKNE